MHAPIGARESHANGLMFCAFLRPILPGLVCLLECARPSGTNSSRGLHWVDDRRMLPDLFFDWLAPNHPVFPIFGGVPDSILGWSAPLPFESVRSLVNPPAKQ